MFGAGLWRRRKLALAALSLAAAAISVRPAFAKGLETDRLHDGQRTVEVARLGPARISWDGVPVGIDDHALVWVGVGASPPDFNTLGVTLESWPSRRLGVARVRGRPGEDGLQVSLRLRGHVGSSLRAVIPDIHIPHAISSIRIPPDDPRYAAQWYFERIDLEAAWRLETGREDVSIVVVDNGCDALHPDLVDKLDPGRDVIDGDDDPSFEPGVSGNEHGTACAGLVGATSDNGIGIAGACPNCRVRCVRLLSDDPASTPLSADVAAFEFALDVGADVVSNSWGFAAPITVPGPLRAIIEEALRSGRDGAGLVVVFAAGNDNRTIGDDELQAIPGVITVGATNNFDESTAFSNRGRSVDVVAPTGTLTTDVSGGDGESPGDYTSRFGGTSSACPVVAGIAGLLVSADADVTAAEVRDLLTTTAAQSFFATPGPDGHDDRYGFGLVRPEAALRALLDLPSDPVDAGTPPPDATAADAGRPDGAQAPDAGTGADGSTPPADDPRLASDEASCSSARGLSPWFGISGLMPWGWAWLRRNRCPRRPD